MKTATHLWLACIFSTTCVCYTIYHSIEKAEKVLAFRYHSRIRPDNNTPKSTTIPLLCVEIESDRYEEAVEYNKYIWK